MVDPHLAAIHDVVSSADGCEDCLMLGTQWVHWRLCLSCGHVGCCDSSPMLHARAHFHATDREDWRWCYVHEALA
jgi:hypothetical protein